MHVHVPLDRQWEGAAAMHEAALGQVVVQATFEWPDQPFSAKQGHTCHSVVVGLSLAVEAHADYLVFWEQVSFTLSMVCNNRRLMIMQPHGQV